MPGEKSGRISKESPGEHVQRKRGQKGGKRGYEVKRKGRKRRVVRGSWKLMPSQKPKKNRNGKTTKKRCTTKGVWY